MTGAEKIVNAMKQVSKSDKQLPSEIITVTVVNINPLIFQLENRLQITNEFYELSNLFDWTKATVNQVFRALSFNEGQKYYILEPYPLQTSTNSSKMDERIKTNRTDINNLTNTVNSISGQVTNIINGTTILAEDIYSLDEIKIETWLGKPLYRKTIPLESSDFGTGTSTQPIA